MKKATRMFGLATALCLAATACDSIEDATGIDDDEDSNFQVVLKPESSTAAAMASAVPEPLRAIVDLANVSSITLPIGRVEVHQVGGAWIDAGDVNDDIDLLDLPAGGIELVDSELPDGDYDAVRFFLDGDATITLDESLVVGRTTFDAGTHELEIPSADQTGLKLNADFTIEDGDGELLTVLFDGDASVRRVTATGSGVLKISPVLRVMNGDGDDVGEFDPDDDDDGDFEAEFEGVVESVGTGSVTLTNGTVVEVGSETEIEGDILTLEAVAEAVADGEVVEAEGVGELDGSVIVAARIEFEVDDDDGDGDDGDDDEEVEVSGTVTSVNRADASFTLDDDGTDVTVRVASNTVIGGAFSTFDEMADAFDADTEIRAEAEGELSAGGELMATDVDFDIDDEDEGEFSGTVTAVSEAANTVTVALDGGGTLVVGIVSTTVIDATGDLTTFGDVAAAFDADSTVRVEGEGVVEGEVMVASNVRFEVDG